MPISVSSPTYFPSPVLKFFGLIFVFQYVLTFRLLKMSLVGCSLPHIPCTSLTLVLMLAVSWQLWLQQLASSSCLWIFPLYHLHYTITSCVTSTGSVLRAASSPTPLLVQRFLSCVSPALLGLCSCILGLASLATACSPLQLWLPKRLRIGFPLHGKGQRQRGKNVFQKQMFTNPQVQFVLLSSVHHRLGLSPYCEKACTFCMQVSRPFAFSPILASAALGLWEWPGDSQDSTDNVCVVSKSSREMAANTPDSRVGSGGHSRTWDVHSISRRKRVWGD